MTYRLRHRVAVGRRLAVALGLVCLVGLAPGAAVSRSDDSSEPLPISSDLRLRVRDGRVIELEILVGAGDDVARIAARLTGDPVLAESITIWNGGVEAVEGVWLRVPLALLTPEYRRLTLRSLFPHDRRDGEDWIHVARAGALPTYDEGSGG